MNDKEIHGHGANGYENHENGGSGDGAYESLGIRKDERTWCCLCLYLCVVVG